MSTVKSSAENLTLNADGSGNDIIFQSNGSNVATLDQAGLLTATTFAGSGASLTGITGTTTRIHAFSKNAAGKLIWTHTEGTLSLTNSSGVNNHPDPNLLLLDCGPDVLINGESFETVFLRPKGPGTFPPFGAYNSDRYKINNTTQDSTFIPHDVALIKFCQVDESSMQFWRGVVRNITSGANPFSEPMNLPSNINGGLGSWTGYGATYYKVPIMKDTIILDEYIPNIFDIF